MFPRFFPAKDREDRPPLLRFFLLRWLPLFLCECPFAPDAALDLLLLLLPCLLFFDEGIFNNSNNCTRPER